METKRHGKHGNAIELTLEGIKGLKTHKGAVARITKVMDANAETTMRFMVMTKEDGTFVPCVFPTHDGWDRQLALCMAGHGIAVIG